VQACERAAGWQVVDVERKVELPFGETTVVARIDRIDRHEKSGDYRVIDYKTGKIDHGVAGEHRTKVTPRTKLPEHLAVAGAVCFEIEEKGKAVPYRWTNLQLPIYALALVGRGLPLPQPGYLTLGTTEDRVSLALWEGFSQSDLDAAAACAEELVEMIRARIFGPPAERVAYDDFHDLAAGRTMTEAVVAPFGGADGANRVQSPVAK
jgi:ATP-dependent helicase/nuclease subunit B